MYACHPLLCAAYTTGAVLAPAALAPRTAPESTVSARTVPASSRLAVFLILITGPLLPSSCLSCEWCRYAFLKSRSDTFLDRTDWALIDLLGVN